MPISNSCIYIGEVVLGSTVGAPLSTDVNGGLISGTSNIEISSTAGATASITGNTLMTGMTITPVAGTYLVWFSCDIISSTAGAAISVSIYIDTTQKTDSLRKIIPFFGGGLTTGSARGYLATQGMVTVNGSQAIQIEWSATSGTNTASARTMNILRVG